jgi:hypothetical protein
MITIADSHYLQSKVSCAARMHLVRYLPHMRHAYQSCVDVPNSISLYPPFPPVVQCLFVQIALRAQSKRPSLENSTDIRNSPAVCLSVCTRLLAASTRGTSAGLYKGLEEDERPTAATIGRKCLGNDVSL